MPERVVYPQWRNEARDNNYPFADWCSVPAGVAGAFVDASLFFPADGPARLSRISVSEGRVLVEVGQGGETATGEVERGSSAEVIRLSSPAGFARGVLVGAPGFAALFALPAGDTEFAPGAAEFAARVTAPLPRNGVTSLSAAGARLVGDVTLVAEGGVRFVPAPGSIRVDAVGVPAGSGSGEAVARSGIRTINMHSPDASGAFLMVSSLALASDSALRISSGEHGLTFSLAGVK
jgi:hypothetical protein